MAAISSFEDHGLGNTSYLVDLGGGLAAVVDPPRDVEPHLVGAEHAGLRIVASFETHLHADFISGGRELADLVGAEVIAAADAHLHFDCRPVRDGDVLHLGDAEIHVLNTPGHTPEHIAYAIGQPHAPAAVFTGGSLIGGGAARTDLISPDATEQLAREQFRSFRRLSTLPDNAAVYPTHGAGSFCSTGATRATIGTIGDQRRMNPLLAIEDEDEFVRTLVGGYGSFPPYFLRLRDVNRNGPRLIRELDGPRRLSPIEADEIVDSGATLIDARSMHEWAALHPVGAISNQLRPAFASWLGWIAPFGTPIVVLIDEHDLVEAVRQARGIGYDTVCGWIDGGIDAWQKAGLPTVSTHEVDATAAAELTASGATLLDVRQDAEVRLGRIPGAEHIELGDIIAGKGPRKDDVVAFCGHGERSATAASLLESRGFRATNFVGGFGAWKEAGLPTEH